MGKSPLVFAHRGARRQAPENTLPAFQQAVALGADGIELDVQLSSDKQIVVFHDSDLTRITGVAGKVKSRTLAELRELDAGSFFDPSFAGVTIPTLDEVFDLVAPDLLINIELKDFSFNTELADRAAECIMAHGGTDRLLFSSFNPIMLRRAKKLLPGVPLGYLYGPNMPPPLAKGWLAAPVIGKHEARHPEFTMVDEAYMAWARQQGYRVNVWTVNEAPDIRRMIALGVDSIITDVPDLALTLMDES